MSEVVLDGRLTPRDVHRVAVERARVRLDDDALRTVAANRAALERAITAGGPIYGITTGLGALVKEVVPLEQARQAQVNLLRSHAAGVGDDLPREVVRAALTVRLNGLLLGHSGIREEVLDRIAGLLNAGLVPRVPRTGSLGASGDLAPSAHAFLPLIGEGEVVDRTGVAVDGATALRRLGHRPLELQPKEALALINGTHFMSGIGALVAERVEQLLDAADAVAAATLDALGGVAAAYDARVHRLRPLEGQVRVAANVRTMLAGSQRVLPRSANGRVQDAYSLRCVPQVHGAAREAAGFFARLVAVDLNAVTDNPLVVGEPAEVISAGNFHGQSLALAFDTLRLGLADLGAISERRTFRLVSPTLGHGLPAFLSPTPGVASGYMVAQYTAAALVAELRALAHPVSVDTIPTSDNQEDHVSMGMTAATMALDAVERLERVLAVELLCACQALDLAPGAAAAPAVAGLHAVVRERVPPLGEDRPPAGDIAAVTALVAEGRVANALRQEDAVAA
jgi:histidine ammonia-lyase